MKRIISISICMVFLLSASTIFLAQEKMEKEPMTFEEFQTKVKSIIESRNQKLIEHFSHGKFNLMPGQLKDYSTRIVTHGGDVIDGRLSENYWRKIGEGLRGKDLNFSPLHLKFWELDVGPDAPGHKINYVAVEIAKFSFTVGKTKYEGYIDPTYKHRVRCDIE
jgi:hypothetical protein